ncbi:vascular endothelial growth factor A-like [Sitophilus oryzae]|uniref:Vascular endothelial growth factor A-like n=1 Tax=Sitophilus oryzae TaxID=7048 RepID=A0A6J2Y3Y5_SITOR|nr:vascular endothelial growth factor A-like [Sitophilus oryzae]
MENLRAMLQQKMLSQVIDMASKMSANESDDQDEMEVTETLEDMDTTDPTKKYFCSITYSRKEDEDSNYEEDFFDTSDEDDDDDDDFQAEEPTERTIPVAKQYSSLSEYKWDQYGTRQGVTEARNRQLNIRKNSEESRARAAVEHYIRVKNTGSCRNPIPKVIPVQQEYPNPAVTYTPHCTVLYRCAEDTGCCRHDGATCQYKDRVEIPLYFYVKELGSDQAKVEKLTFYNHTECECKEKQEEAVTERHKRTGTPDGGSAEVFNQTRNSGLDLKSRSDGPENIQIRCKCPKEFTPRIKYSSKCYCDCEESNQDCLRMKRGKEYNSLSDRL